tara:strand:+ start:121 stop:624 length:504 start_codon:yes stop_codon:yes gene_type:complete
MATYNVTGPGGTAGHPSKMSAGIRTPYLVENTIDISAINGDSGTAQNDVIRCIDVPAETVILHAGVEVLTACSSSVVIDIGVTGSSAGFSDPDAFVDAYDATGASYAPRDVADAAPVLTCKVADTIDALMAGADSTAGKIRVFAILCDVSGVDETDRNTATQHDTAV